MARNVQLIEREANPRHRLTGALLEELRRLAGAD
jgi:hypothetical protein